MVCVEGKGMGGMTGKYGNEGSLQAGRGKPGPYLHAAPTTFPHETSARQKSLILMDHQQRGTRRGVKRNRGGTFVEFALVIPLFFLLTFAIVDFGYLFYMKLTLENAVRQAGRFAITGNHLTSTNGTTESRIQSIENTAVQAAAGLPISNIVITTPGGGTNQTGSAGGPGAPVTVSLTVTYTFFTHFIGKFFPGGQNVFTVSTTFRNEDFSTAQTD
jgi:Flp pilus assembly protein TadG